MASRCGQYEERSASTLNSHQNTGCILLASFLLGLICGARWNTQYELAAWSRRPTAGAGSLGCVAAAASVVAQAVSAAVCRAVEKFLYDIN